MAKRGRPRDPQSAGKTATILARVSPEVRERLESAALESKHSLSREVESRLAESFDDEGGIASDLGTPHTRAALLLISDAITEVEQLIGERWYKNRYACEQVVEAARAVFENFKPRGKGGPPASFPVLGPGIPDATRKELRDDLMNQGVGRVIADTFCKMVERVPRESPKERAAMAATLPHVVSAARLLRTHLTKAPIKFGFKVSSKFAMRSKAAKPKGSEE